MASTGSEFSYQVLHHNVYGILRLSFVRGVTSVKKGLSSRSLYTLPKTVDYDERKLPVFYPGLVSFIFRRRLRN